jgi:hypothetical protein
MAKNKKRPVTQKVEKRKSAAKIKKRYRQNQVPSKKVPSKSYKVPPNKGRPKVKAKLRSGMGSLGDRISTPRRETPP